MTSADRLMDEAIAVALILDRLSRHSFQVAAERLARLREDLLVLVIRHDPTSLRYEANRRARLAALIEECETVISQTYLEIAARIEQDLLDAETLTQDSLSSLIALLLFIKGLSRRLDTEALETVRDGTLITGVTVRDWLARQSGDLRFRTRAALEGTMRGREIGRPARTNDLIDAIRHERPGSLFGTAMRHSESLIISAHHAVANSVRFETIIRHPELFRALQHLSILDSRTTDICESRANRLWTLDGVGIGHRMVFMRPPIHYRCRSHIVPVMHRYADLSPRIQRRVRREDFTGTAARQPELNTWLSERGLKRDGTPTDYTGARRDLGL